MTIISDKAMNAKPGKTDTWLIEGGARGEGRLIGRITPAGARSFYFRYTASSGDRVRLLIGSYDPRGDGHSAFTVQQARDKGRDLSALYRSGLRDLREHLQQVAEDQRQAEAAKRTALEEAERAAQMEAERRLTVRQVFDRWCQTDLQPAVRSDGKRTGRQDGGAYVRSQFERHVFPTIGDRAATEVRKSDLLALLDIQKSAGKLRTANVLLSDLKQMLDFALERELILANPLATVKKSKVGGAAVERDRVLSDDELRALPAAIASARLSPRSAAAIWLTLATGVRVGELMGAVWVQSLPTEPKAKAAHIDALRAMAEADEVKLGIIDTTARTWYLPTTKNQRDHRIHLSDFALEQLETLYQLREVLVDSPNGALTPWVFPATDNSRPVCVKSFGKQLADRQRQPEERMSGRSKNTQSLALEGGKWTAHDLRRTAATLMAKMGFSSDTINECLNHIQSDRMARVYIQDRRQAEQLLAFNALGARLAELCSGKVPASNVVPLKAA